MICEKCAQERKKSTVMLNPYGSATLMGWSYHYDSDGVFHSHDPNKITTEGKCSNSHYFKKITTRKCPAEGCDYGGTIEVKYKD